MQTFQHQFIQIKDLFISYGEKRCIENFSTDVYYGERIGIIGRNGCGKTSLLKLFTNDILPYEGDILLPEDVNCGYVPQLIETSINLSGGQKFNQALSEVIALEPNVLLLDEPTNHLDQANRKSLMGMLKRYLGTLIIVTHDTELLRNCTDTIWHITNGEVKVYKGSYDEYLYLQQTSQKQLVSRIKEYTNEKYEAHEKLMKEQKRSKNSKEQGEKHIRQRKWPTITSVAKASRAETTSGKNNKRIENSKQKALNSLSQLYVPEVIVPKFYLDAKKTSIDKVILNITHGSCAYLEIPILSEINFTLKASDKVVFLGDNASGKSTLFKAILKDINVKIQGEWLAPTIEDIGYLDQHYQQLNPDRTAVQLMQILVPMLSYAEIRNHLNSFLLRKNEEVNLEVKFLSGGEKARLSLALIAAKPPKLLLLDEITNNVDLETKDHLLQVLKEYPGAFILICHDNDFVERLQLNSKYLIADRSFTLTT